MNWMMDIVAWCLTLRCTFLLLIHIILLHKTDIKRHNMTFYCLLPVSCSAFPHRSARSLAPVGGAGSHRLRPTPTRGMTAFYRNCRQHSVHRHSRSSQPHFLNLYWRSNLNKIDKPHSGQS